MRHLNKNKSFSRTSSHRQAMFRHLAVALLRHEVITTTLIKAKELRRVVEPLITLAKEDSLAHRRLVFSRLRSRDTVTTLFTKIGPRSAARQGGYLRIIKSGFRAGDKAPMALVELVDREKSE